MDAAGAAVRREGTAERMRDLLAKVVKDVKYVGPQTRVLSPKFLAATPGASFSAVTAPFWRAFVSIALAVIEGFE